MSSADAAYEEQNDIPQSSDVPMGDSTDNSYASRTGQSTIPVLKDEAGVEDPIDAGTADSDETLGMLHYPHLLSQMFRSRLSSVLRKN